MLLVPGYNNCKALQLNDFSSSPVSMRIRRGISVPDGWKGHFNLQSEEGARKLTSWSEASYWAGGGIPSCEIIEVCENRFYKYERVAFAFEQGARFSFD